MLVVSADTNDAGIPDALAISKAKEPLVSFEFDRRELRPRDVALEILYSGICHSDIHQAREEWIS